MLLVVDAVKLKHSLDCLSDIALICVLQYQSVKAYEKQRWQLGTCDRRGICLILIRVVYSTDVRSVLIYDSESLPLCTDDKRLRYSITDDCAILPTFYQKQPH